MGLLSMAANTNSSAASNTSALGHPIGWTYRRLWLGIPSLKSLKPTTTTTTTATTVTFHENYYLNETPSLPLAPPLRVASLHFLAPPGSTRPHAALSKTLVTNTTAMNRQIHVQMMRSVSLQCSHKAMEHTRVVVVAYRTQTLSSSTSSRTVGTNTHANANGNTNTTVLQKTARSKTSSTHHKPSTTTTGTTTMVTPVTVQTTVVDAISGSEHHSVEEMTAEEVEGRVAYHMLTGTTNEEEEEANQGVLLALPRPSSLPYQALVYAGSNSITIGDKKAQLLSQEALMRSILLATTSFPVDSARGVVSANIQRKKAKKMTTKIMDAAEEEGEVGWIGVWRPCANSVCEIYRTQFHRTNDSNLSIPSNIDAIPRTLALSALVEISGVVSVDAYHEVHASAYFPAAKTAVSSAVSRGNQPTSALPFKFNTASTTATTTAGSSSGTACIVAHYLHLSPFPVSLASMNKIKDHSDDDNDDDDDDDDEEEDEEEQEFEEEDDDKQQNNRKKQKTQTPPQRLLMSVFGHFNLHSSTLSHPEHNTSSFHATTSRTATIDKYGNGLCLFVGSLLCSSSATTMDSHGNADADSRIDGMEVDTVAVLTKNVSSMVSFGVDIGRVLLSQRILLHASSLDQILFAYYDEHLNHDDGMLYHPSMSRQIVSDSLDERWRHSKRKRRYGNCSEDDGQGRCLVAVLHRVRRVIYVLDLTTLLKTQQEIQERKEVARRHKARVHRQKESYMCAEDVAIHDLEALSVHTIALQDVQLCSTSTPCEHEVVSITLYRTKAQQHAQRRSDKETTTRKAPATKKKDHAVFRRFSERVDDENEDGAEGDEDVGDEEDEEGDDEEEEYALLLQYAQPVRVERLMLGNLRKT